MSRHQTPRHADSALLVSEYVCGLLKPEERASVHVLLSKDDQALAQALAWENELLSLVDALPPALPSPALRERLQRTLGIDPPPAFEPPPQPQLLRQPSAPAHPVIAPERTKSRLFEKPAPLKSGATVQAAASAPATPADRTPASSATPTPSSAAQTSATVTPSAATASSAATAPSSVEPSPVPPAPPSGASPASAVTAIPAPSPAASPSVRAKRARAEDNRDPALARLVRKLWFWRLIGVAATAAALVGFMLPGEPPPAPVQVVKVAPTRAAIMLAPGTSSTPGWTATLGPQGELRMRPLVHTEVPAGSQTLLWTRSARIPQPRLLGRIDPNQPVLVPAAQLGSIADDQLLEITLETDADAAKGEPNGPILFIGQMTVFGAEGASVGEGSASASGASASSGAIE